jgi:hypothetical protein
MVKKLYKKKNNFKQKILNKYRKYLDLGWCQGYMALQYHLEEAILEILFQPNGFCKIASTSILLQNNNISSSPQIAIFSHKYYNQIQEIKNIKIHDYCWIGSIESCKEYRIWIIDFAKKNFTKNSIFINTDFPDDWIKLGDYDLTNFKIGYNPKLQKDNQSKDIQYRKVEENLFYFQCMRQSKFCLCPRGDAPWSFRFYEILMCESIPIVNNIHDTYRTLEESLLDYKFLLKDNEISYDESIITHNTKIFRKIHLLN